MRIVDVLYSHELGLVSHQELFEKHAAAMGHHTFLGDKVELHVIRHFNGSGKEIIRNVHYYFFKGSVSKFWLPIRQHLLINRLNPEIILVHGFLNPLQLILLKLQCRAKIILQYHGGKKPVGITGFLQKLINKFLKEYIFTAKDQADPFIKNGFISSTSNISEILEGSTHFTKQNKYDSRIKLGMRNNEIFLWVGRLEKNKDPITVLTGFEKYLERNADAQLFMIYQEIDLLTEVSSLINNNTSLKKAVIMVGQIDHAQLPQWFSAADYYISGSHREGSGYALIEAMACGCIPIVTNIPSFKKIAGNHGFFFEPGNAESLFTAIEKTSNVQKEQSSTNIVNYFNEQLSFKKIADDIFKLCNELTIK